MSLNKPKIANVFFSAVVQLKQHKTYRYIDDMITIEFDSDPEDGTSYHGDDFDIEQIADIAHSVIPCLLQPQSDTYLPRERMS